MTKLRQFLVSVLMAVGLLASIGFGFIALGAGVVLGALVALMVWVAPKEPATDSEVQEQSMANPEPA